MALRCSLEVLDQLNPYSLIIPVVKEHQIVRGPVIKVLDIGVGANGVYSIVGVGQFEWSFLAPDINPVSVKAGSPAHSFSP